MFKMYQKIKGDRLIVILIQAALKYKGDELGEWETICIPTNKRIATDIVAALEKAQPQWKYRIETIK